MNTTYIKPMDISFGKLYFEMLQRVTSGVAKHFNTDIEKINDLLFDKFISNNYHTHYEDTIGLSAELISNGTFINSKWIFSFEGIDATGKQTIVTTLKDYFNYVSKRTLERREPGLSGLSTPMNNVARKWNIPDYELESGQEISEILQAGNYNTELLQIKFALNRKEVQNRIELDHKMTSTKTRKYYDFTNTESIILFDRWVDSGAMYKLSKEAYNYINEHPTLMSDDIVTGVTGVTSKTYEDKVVDLITSEEFLKSFHKQIKLEHTTLGLVRPHIKFLCYTPIEEVQKRLISRAEATGIPMDSHEKNISFLNLTQELYSYIYKNLHVFFKNEIFTAAHKNYKIINTFENNQEQSLTLIIIKIIETFGLESFKIKN